MNAPVCPRCGTPLAPGLTACGNCGLPYAPAAGSPQQGAQPPAYGAVPANPFTADQAGHGGPAGAQPGPQQGGAPGDRPPRRRGLVIGGVAGALLLVAGIAALVLWLTSGDDDKDDVAGEEESSQTEDSTDEPTDDTTTAGDPTDQPTDDPTDDPSASTPPSTAVTPATPRTSGAPLVRTAPTGSDEDQIAQLVVDTDAWLQSVLEGDASQCDQMSDYFAKASQKNIDACKQSFTGTSNPSDRDFEFSIEAGKVTVNGNKGTVVLKTTSSFDGSESKDSTTEDVVKKGGVWYFADAS